MASDSTITNIVDEDAKQYASEVWGREAKNAIAAGRILTADEELGVILAAYEFYKRSRT